MNTRRERLIYRTLLWLLWLPLFLYTAWQAFKARDLRYLRNGFGLFERGGNVRPLWFHAASVGEVNALLPLIETVRIHHPSLALLVTTTTLTGAATVRKKGGRGDVEFLHFDACYYRPIEWAIAHGIRHFDPGAGGGHKLRRGFRVVPNCSLHRFADARLRQVMDRHIGAINRLEHHEIAVLNSELPLRQAPS